MRLLYVEFPYSLWCVIQYKFIDLLNQAHDPQQNQRVYFYENWI